MKQIRDLFIDERSEGICVFCGGVPDTRDHVPPRVFLDKPYPENLPVVASCFACNNGASVDEEYVACLIEVAVCGTTDPDSIRRDKIARTLRKKPSLVAKMAGSLKQGGLVLSGKDVERVNSVVGKMAYALWAFENSGSSYRPLASLQWSPLPELTQEELDSLFTSPPMSLFHEIGSRGLIRELTDPSNFWQEVQPGRFAYATDGVGQVSIVIGDYLLIRASFLNSAA
jgi:hypothetical protein